ncbi:aspartyl/glutamyl-tRNA amidotransferase subunit B [Candidatus Desulfofervidus auxilii]|uniref:Aspartyl/glutamyl-tRNA(Asn/Gln) amidotransferase subunit B n=1 Tax=Desulfofervidus auxilii TaxID=1621989 RepID=A0A7V1N2A3_DESA2|nr:Asp-tRNA(Asn)/Glu-tRNA(Gln) amidotransferase subunit GatB [Candidatus Desulfofervidus auxilii]AMM40398.1 aspartyl/glutamyl-tRNA amidotransferase subunit B [Candidatus Desulfofervidus auxilii]CAD7777397.1 MAG: Aspartyl/glutamyl-tRNA(Asn/Gln) amidotransferasesubunit B [Candidatus Methanoperedenaceae archaeon GB50]HEB73822.1 Asp-tRNA(Asn)/Glu-tRNA(Gln) amidotransferase subunit GatB [Candidatus Desulfofervidus auxilii]
MSYEAVIGLEVHAQLLTESKIFCSCSTKFGALPNSHVCPVCMGMPGVLPVLNKKVVEFALKMALATHCRINTYSVFARKNYFYPDLPKGYQISQYEHPLAEEGWVEIEVNGYKKQIGIIRIHMEEDAGKLMHDPHKPISYVDFNRTGVPLIEIVSKPDIRTPEEGVAYLKKLRSILRYLEICDGNMEEGSFRCDANISLRLVNTEKFGVRTELKNMNSFKHVQRALTYEIERQRSILEQGGKVIQETRLWDENKGITRSMRGKEEAHDYRYFPDPDLMPVVIDKDWIEEIRKTLPELPDVKKQRFKQVYGLPEYDAEVLTSEKDLAEYFERVVKWGSEAKLASNWVMSEVLRKLNEEKREIQECPVKPKDLAELLQLVQKGTISGKIAKTVFEEMYASGKPASQIVKEKGLIQITDQAVLQEIAQKIIESYPKEVEQYKAGKEKLLGFFVGQMMKQTKGKANPQLVNKIFKELLQK